MRRQFDEKSAESEEEKLQREARDLEIKNQLAGLLATVIQAIFDEKFNLGKDNEGKWILSNDTLKAIAIFREALDALHPKVINKDKLFRLNTVLETYGAYALKAREWGYQLQRCALFQDGVLSSVLCYLPENDAQKCSQGFYFLLKRNPPEPLKRSLKLCVTNINFYDFLRGPSRDFSNLAGACVDILFGEPRTFQSVEGQAYSFLKTYVEQKQRTGSAYATHWETPSLSVSNSVSNLVK